jgi:hypothetical protein
MIFQDHRRVPVSVFRASEEALLNGLLELVRTFMEASKTCKIKYHNCKL